MHDPEAENSAHATAPPLTVAELIAAIKQGREDLLPQLRAALDEHPDLWHPFGSLAFQAHEAWLDRIAKNDLLAREQITRSAADLRQRLVGPEATELEKLQVERIVALHMQLGYYESLLARKEAHVKEDKEAEFLQARYGVASRRLQEAIVVLARVRKLLPRPVRVEVALSGTVETRTAAADRARCPAQRASASGTVHRTPDRTTESAVVGE